MYEKSHKNKKNNETVKQIPTGFPFLPHRTDQANRISPSQSVLHSLRPFLVKAQVHRQGAQAWMTGLVRQ